MPVLTPDTITPTAPFERAVVTAAAFGQAWPMIGLPGAAAASLCIKVPAACITRAARNAVIFCYKMISWRARHSIHHSEKLCSIIYRHFWIDKYNV